MDGFLLSMTVDHPMISRAVKGFWGLSFAGPLNAIWIGIIFVLFAAFIQQYSYQCAADNEGSWAVGLAVGKDPLHLTPLERMEQKGSASNPIITCSSLGDEKASFVADPFLLDFQGSVHVFYEAKNTVTQKGEIGVSRVAFDGSGGVSTRFLGIVLRDPVHLSYPFVFVDKGEAYMIPETTEAREVRLYRADASQYPLVWLLERKLLHNLALVDPSVVWAEGSDGQHGRGWWMVGYLADTQTTACFHAESLAAVWKRVPAAQQSSDRSMGRPAGSLFFHQGALYRFVQSFGRSYGEDVLLRRISMLDTHVGLLEHTVPEWLSLRAGSWSAKRHHHVSVQATRAFGSNATFVAVFDGDSRTNGWREAAFWRYTAAATVLVVVIHFASLAIAALPSRCKSSTRDLVVAVPPLALRCVLILIAVLGAISLWHAYQMWPFVVEDIISDVQPLAASRLAHHEQLTVIIPSYTPRLKYLQKTISHYTSCDAVSHVEVVWNMRDTGRDKTIQARDFAKVTKKAVIVRIQSSNSILNRWRAYGHADEEITAFHPDISSFRASAQQRPFMNRAVLSLDDDILIPCSDIADAFHTWKEHTAQIVGFFPRGAVPERNSTGFSSWRYIKDPSGLGTFNLILGGAAIFHVSYLREVIDNTPPEARDLVESLFNCEDILLNFAVANLTGLPPVYVQPQRVVRQSGQGLSSKGDHFIKRSHCINAFTSMYGPKSPLKRQPFKQGEYVVV